MAYDLKYINIFDDINSANMADIQDFYSKADLRVEDKFPVPSFNDSQELQQSLEKLGELTADSIKRHLMTYSMLDTEAATELSKSMLNELRLVVPSENALKSNYGKIAYWLKTMFSGVLSDKNNNIYIKNSPNKHELYTIYALSKLSNNIVIIDFEYQKDKYKLYNNFVFNTAGTVERINISFKIEMDIDKLIEVITGTVKMQACKIIAIGEDESKRVDTSLVKLAANTPENVLLLKTGIEKVSFDEVNSVPRPNVQSVEQLTKMIGKHMFMRNAEYADKATLFIKRELLTESNLNKAVTKLITFICLYNRYKITEDMLLSYGKVDTVAEVYVDFLEFIGKTIIVIDTLGETLHSSCNQEWVQVILGEKSVYHDYPDVEVNNTMAFNASREINDTLYTGETLGLYRDRQYKTCGITVLNTTFDELLLLWKQENTVKPAFTSTNNSVTVPVFYTKVIGACSNYEQKLGQLVTEHSIVCYRPEDILTGRLNDINVNHFAGVNNTLFKEQKPMYKNGKLDIDTIINYKTFPYKHLELALQKHILAKIDTLLQDNWINHTGMSNEDFIDLVLNIGLNLSKRIQQEMQWYDYTKQSPKLVILCQDEAIISLEQSIIITLLHLCGWDIVIAIPTCYNILGNSLRVNEMQEHILGEPRFDFSISQLEPCNSTNEKKKGFFSRLFN